MAMVFRFLAAADLADCDVGEIRVVEQAKAINVLEKPSKTWNLPC